MAPNGPSDLSKLTVPQLKALCKERRITGYSKLAKAALLQKLAEAVQAAPTQATASSNAQSSTPSAFAVPSTTPTDEIQNPTCIEPSTVHRDVPQPVQQAVPPTTGNTKSTKSSTTRAPLSIEPPKQNQAVTDPPRVEKTSGTKRPAHTDIVSPKRTRITPTEPANDAGQGSPSNPRIPVLQQTLPVSSAVFKVPNLPTPGESFRGGIPIPAKQTAGVNNHLPAPRQVTSGPGRFKPLAVSRPKPTEAGQTNIESSRALASRDLPRVVDSVHISSVCEMPVPVLSHILFPPKASERRWVYRWAVVLSALSLADRQTCMLVSRTIRYAVYLSATTILSRDYSGSRLDALFKQYPGNMTNFWPYLRFRAVEVSKRRQAFKHSFLGRYTNSMEYDPLSKRLWTSPDDEKQVSVALRFVLTRMWFAVSVGAYGHDASTWSKCVIRDAREVVKDEVWQVVAQDNNIGKECSFYVLEATCEVIGQPPSSHGENTLGYPLRADWMTWVSQRSRVSSDAGSSTLLERIKWSNTEDYYRGISKAWLRRVQGEDADSIAKRGVAERYILASVVANGISGPWMSTNTMAQEFAGLPTKGIESRVAGRPVNTVNMYLPAHHHIESVHFTTSKGEALHDAIAVVQTPGREYFVLKDNGMQVGCEEEGIPEVWQQVLGCDILGRAR